MLKRLEMVGFKSFADKTQFDFPPGVTGIVGPNGSGKSNVVDAVKWILGAQSAKSLRGGEMADVIFNGSASRKSFGMAEVSVTFDNAGRILATEADEVLVTRRVYRDGTGEYLINGHACRLKDVKDLFLGSGAGGAAYCIIEQGRVDALLQASTRDRRIIFEEAAGVSRFRARKLEAGRKLERVEGNLQRLRDIIAEVDKQLRKVQFEASKAQKYQEFTARLRELRLGLATRMYAGLTEELDADRARLDDSRSGLEQTLSQTADWEQEIGELDARLAASEGEMRAAESRLGEARQRVTSERLTREHASRSVAELETELDRLRDRRVRQGYAILDFVRSSESLMQAVTDADGKVDAQQAGADSLGADLSEIDDLLGEARPRLERSRADYMDAVRREANAHNEAANAGRHLDEVTARLTRQRQKAEHTWAELESLDLVIEDLARTGEDLKGRLDGTREALTERLRLRDSLAAKSEEYQRDLTDLRIRRGGVRSRVDVLEELEGGQEGFSAGVSEILELLKRDDGELSGLVIGLAADLIEVPGRNAPLIDLALGEELAQSFVVTDVNRVTSVLTDRGIELTGRVTLVPLTASAPSTVGRISNPSESDGLGIRPTVPEEGVANAIPADRLVRAPNAELAALASRLLGNTWVVDDLPTARGMAGGGVQFVTRTGERLRPDGTLTIGDGSPESGIFSRKSELRDLRRELAELDERIVESEADHRRVSEEHQAAAASALTLEEAIDTLAEQAGDLNTQRALRQRRREDLAAEADQFEAELETLQRERTEAEDTLGGLKRQAEAVSKAVKQAHTAIGELDRAIAEHERQRQEVEKQYTAARVTLAQLGEQAAAARSRMQQAEAEAMRMGREVTEIESKEAEVSARLSATRLDMLRCSMRLAESHAEQETLTVEIAGISRGRSGDRGRREELTGLLNAARSSHQERLAQVHECEMAVRELEKNREVLTERMREDYQVELGELFHARAEAVAEEAGEEAEGEAVAEAAPDPVAGMDDDKIEAEIATLKTRIGRLGSVSLESLDELNEVETRHRDLRIQHDDLTAARQSLNEIIERINADSRRMFSETFETVRSHFQELFRKLFGGGMADVVLENPDDVLESGVEVMARPPGKELRSISLMSGGEKTLTAVALLLAMFKSKPSPFCLLDEVDAALDEANTERLASVLKDFARDSQFIVITHAKRTMAAADVLFGVTMQESGISKRIAMRFEDWAEEEEQVA